MDGRGAHAPWQRDTLVDVFSRRQGDGGAVRADARRARRRSTWTRRWRATGPSSPPRARATSRCACCSPTGRACPAVRRALPEHAMYDWDVMAGALAAEEPWWPPGLAHGYHVNTFGFLAGELVRRVSGATHRRRSSGARSRAARRRLPLRPRRRATTRAPPSTCSAARRPIRRRCRGSASRVEADEDRRFLLDRRVPEPARAVGHRHRQHARVARRRDTVGERPRDRARRWRGYTARSPASGAVGEVRDRCAGDDRRGDRGSLVGTRLRAWVARRGSGSDSSSPSRSGRSARTRAASATSAPAARSDSPTPTRGWPSPTSMNRSGPRWQNPRNRALIDAVYEALAT